MEDEDIDMETVHDSQAFIHHHLNLLERPSTPGNTHTHTHDISYINLKNKSKYHKPGDTHTRPLSLFR